MNDAQLIMTISAVVAVFIAYSYGKAEGKYNLYLDDKTKNIGKHDSGMWESEMKINTYILLGLLILFFIAPLIF